MAKNETFKLGEQPSERNAGRNVMVSHSAEDGGDFIARLGDLVNLFYEDKLGREHEARCVPTRFPDQDHILTPKEILVIASNQVGVLLAFEPSEHFDQKANQARERAHSILELLKFLLAYQNGGASKS